MRLLLYVLGREVIHLETGPAEAYDAPETITTTGHLEPATYVEPRLGFTLPATDWETD